MRTLVLLAATLFASTASAKDCRIANASAERAAFGTDMAIWGASGILFGASASIEPRHGDGSWIPPIDRNVPTTLDEAHNTASDLLLITGALTGFAGGFVHMGACGREGATAFAWVNPVLESFGTGMLTMGATQVTKVAAGRPRPWTHGDHDGAYFDGDEYHSFFSGHTSIAAWGYTYGVAEILRVTNLPWWGRALVGFGTGTAGGLATGSQRVAAAKHYWSDVLVGWAVGTTIGLVPTLLDPAWDRMAERRVAVSGSVSTEHVSLRVDGAF